MNYRRSVRRLTALATLAFLSTLNNHFSTGIAQGSLFPPPGAPAPVMKSLDQVEARIPLLPGQPGVTVNAAGTPNVYYTITNAGSYYLTTNISAVAGEAVTIQANNVTLDLNGYSIVGNPSAVYHGVWLNGGRTNIVIRNGNIMNCGYNGVEAAANGNSQNVVIEQINVTGCSTVWPGNKAGIAAGAGSVVRHCSAAYNKGNGFFSRGVVVDCVATANQASGFQGGGRIENCTAKDNAQNGIHCHILASTIRNNTCIGNNTGNSSSYAGIAIDTTADYSHVENNHIIANDVGTAGRGIWVSGYKSVITRNSVTGYGANNYVFVAGETIDAGPTGTAAAATNPFANLSN